MSNFKSGSGNLDFGRRNNTEEEDEESEIVDTQPDEKREIEMKSTEANSSDSPARATSNTDGSFDQSQSSWETTRTTPSADTPLEEYPYFIRRSNVGDERDTRFEIHVRDKVADQEAKFRNELAEQLGANEVSKTDAREFALLAAFNNPEHVAELMKEEGFGTLG